MTADPLPDLRRRFRDAKALADGALAQIPDEAWFRTLDPESNSIACLVRHLAGNMRSRWQDFLTSDGEKPDRHRDREFEDPVPAHVASPAAVAAAVADLRDRWEAGWALLFENLDALGPDDLSRTITIRGEPHSVIQATQRQFGHACYHVGQIVFLAKHFAGPGWRTLSVPRGGSAAHNTEMLQKHGVPPGRRAP